MNPECRKWQELLLQNRFHPDPAHEPALRDHLAACSDCRRAFEEFTLMQEMFHECDAAPVPAWFSTRVMRAVSAERGSEATACRRGTSHALAVLSGLVLLEGISLLWAPLRIQALLLRGEQYGELAGRWLAHLFTAPLSGLILASWHDLIRSGAAPILSPWWSLWAAGLLIGAGLVAEMKRSFQ